MQFKVCHLPDHDFIDAETSTHAQSLFAIKAWQVTEQILESVVERTFIGVVIDQINTWAFEMLSEIPIVETDQEYVLV
jgi:hypothetical protein